MSRYQLLLFKRILEDVIIFPFVLLGQIIAKFNPLNKEYRVFYFFPFYHTGGAEKVHAQIAEATAGKDCIIFFTRKSGNEQFYNDFKNSGAQIKNISKFTDNKWLYFLNLIYRGIISSYINKQNLKPIIFNGQCNFGYKISPWIKNHIPQIELIHSLNSFSFIRIPFLPFITQTVMISRQRIEDHKELYKQYKIPDTFIQKIQYIPNAIKLPANEANTKASEPFVVLYVGRAGKEKRVQLVAQMAERLQQKDKSIQFEMMGDVSDVIKTNQYPYIRFHGNQSDPEIIHSIYSKAYMLVLTSTTEGFPMALIEAMAHGCVILATAVGDIPFHIKKENGFLFSSVEDEEAIVNEAENFILQLKNNRHLFNTISKYNLNYAKHNFGIDSFNKAYKELFETVKT